MSSEFMALVAVHSRDVNGASKAGLASGWVSRSGKPFPKGVNLPDVQGKTLVEVVENPLSLRELK